MAGRSSVVDHSSRRPSLRCRIGRHAWVARRNERGENYLECKRCRKFRDPSPFTGPVGRGPAAG